MNVRPRLRSGSHSGNRLLLTIPGGPEAAAEARTAVELVGRDLGEDARDVLRLLISEVITNSVEHGRADQNALVRMDITNSEHAVRVAVTDLGPGFTPTRPPLNPRVSRGRGLLILDRLAARWGTNHGGRWSHLEARAV